MAPLTKTLVLAALAAMVSARPLVARAPAPSMVTETAWTTVDVPVTLWVDENGNPLSTVAQGGNFAAVPTTPSTTTAATSTTTPVAVAPVQPASPSTTLATTTTSAMVYQQPQPVITSTTTPAPVAPVVPSSSAAPAAAASAAPASGGSSGDSSVRSIASSTNSCEGESAACSGDITYYSGGLGACGWNVDTSTDMSIALPYEFMGTQSNGNPYCGRSLTIMNPTTGQTIQAKVGDKCMGCTGRSIDLTEALFNDIGGGCDGRCSGFDWWFN